MAKKESLQSESNKFQQYQDVYTDLRNLSTVYLKDGSAIVKYNFDIASKYLFEKRSSNRRPRTIFSSEIDKLKGTIEFYATAEQAAVTQGNQEIIKISRVGIQRASDRLRLLNSGTGNSAPGKK